MRFSKALDYLMDEASPTATITRSDWYGSKAKPIVRLQLPDENSKMTEPYLYMEKLVEVGGKWNIARFPLDLSCESILSMKWEINCMETGASNG